MAHERFVAEHGGELTRNLAITRQDGCMTDVTFDHASLHARSLDDPEGFWLEAASGVDWITRPKGALDASSAPLYRWFPDARLNTCYNALDRHVIAGRADQPALIHDSAVTGTSRTYTYAELLDEVARLAGVLQALGVEKGDRVIIYMPMVPEALEAMLACSRLGAIHSVVFGGFAANELAVRIDDCQPKAIIAASCGLEPGRVVHYKPLLDKAIELASHKPDFCVIFQREQEVAKLIEGRDVAWHTFQYGVEPAECVPVEGNHPHYILYTSGTTGQPKGVLRDHMGLDRAALAGCAGSGRAAAGPDRRRNGGSVADGLDSRNIRAAGRA